jgi:hypothetical protein
VTGRCKFDLEPVLGSQQLSLSDGRSEHRMIASLMPTLWRVLRSR